MGDLLFLSHCMPFPPDKGEKIRAFHVLKHLAKNNRIHLGCFTNDPEDEKHAAALREHCATVFVAPLGRKLALARGLAGLAMGHSLSESYFHDARMTRFVSETMARVRPDKIFLFCSAMTPYGLPYASSHRVVLDMVDVDSEKYRAYAEQAAFPLAPLYAREARALLALERRAAMAFYRSFFVSKEEAGAFLAQAPDAAGRVGFFQNGVNLDYFSRARTFDSPFAPERTPIVFTGTMDYRPNVEAVEWFAGQVFPRLKRDYPDVEFWVVGANPAAAVKRLAATPGIRVTGRVPDVRPYLAHAACAVAPLHIARGLQNKVLEAMAMARPVVATPAACEGISALPGSDVLLAETPAQFAAAVASVLKDEASGLGRNARARVEADYDWSRNLEVLDGLWRESPGIRSVHEAALSHHARNTIMGIAS